MRPFLEGLNLDFPQEYLRAALLVSLLSVWMLVGLFYYLNHYTKREYFAVWTAAWLFYALWLTLNLEVPQAKTGGIVFVFKEWCVAVSAVFLLWGSLRFLSLPGRQTLFGLFMLFLLVWTVASPQILTNNVLAIELPVFILIGLGSIFAGACFLRLRRKMPFVGAGMLSFGFLLWGLYLASYPLEEKNKDLSGAGIFIGAVLQLFIAVSMVVLVLEEVRFNAEKVRAEIAAVRSEKEALQAKVLSAEEECRNLYNQVRLTQGVQTAYDELRRTHQVVVQQERLRALGEMSSGVAHDINNSLSPVLGYSELMLATMPDLPEKARKYLGLIHKSGGDIAGIVARMREFYRRRSKTETLHNVNLNQVVLEIIELTRPRWRDLAQREGITINVQSELAPSLPLLMGDAGELREALTNLIFNSVDALPRGGTITLLTRSVDGAATDQRPAGERRVQVEVRDDGTGMDEKTRQHCLEPFFSTKVQRGGSGLGLAMVYGMVQRHNGTIEIDSAPDKGTCIRLTFPVRTLQAQTVTLDLAKPRPPRSLNILCIDDEAQIRDLLRDCLTRFNHQVAVAASGKEGLALFRAATKKDQPYEVVITDKGMPDMDGRQVAKIIKAESPGTPVIMMTGWATIMRDDQKPLPEVDALIDKPPQIERLNSLLLELAN